MVNNIFLGLGSNLGEKETFIRAAIKKIDEDSFITIKESSSLYETEPYGVKDQSPFLNLVLKVSSDYSPEDLLRKLKQFEKEIGRTDSERWGPREIDIDILLYNNILINTKELKIPHPDIKNRDFVLYPIMEIAPDLFLPNSDKSISDLVKNLTEKTILNKIEFSY